MLNELEQQVLAAVGAEPTTIDSVVAASGLPTGSVLATMFTEPLASAFGWQIALAAWGLLALAGLGVWWVLMHVLRGARAANPAAAASVSGQAEREPLWRNRIAWVLGLAFAGQATSYYTITAWLPSILGDEVGLDRSSAGALSGVFQGLSIAGALANHFGCRAVSILGSCIAALGSVASYFATSVMYLIISVGVLMGKLLNSEVEKLN